jgi:hypothetical protein
MGTVSSNHGRRVLVKNIGFSATDKFHGIFLSAYSVGPSLPSDIYWDQVDIAGLGTTSGNQRNVMFANITRFAIVGSSFPSLGQDPDLEHFVRVRQGDHFVADANHFTQQQEGRAVITLRQNETYLPDIDEWFVISRNFISGGYTGMAVQIAGGNPPDTPNVKKVLIDSNVFTVGAGLTDDNLIVCDTGDSQVIDAVSFNRNYINLTGVGSATTNVVGFDCDGGFTNIRARANVGVYTSTHLTTGEVQLITLPSGDAGRACENTVLYYKSGDSQTDVCTNVTEGADSPKVVSDPFDFTAGDPASAASVDLDEVKITTSSVLYDVGVCTYLDQDVFGNAIAANCATVSSGVHEP